jgi:hypothetical protein
MQTVEILEARVGIKPSSHCKYASYYKNYGNAEAKYTAGDRGYITCPGVRMRAEIL